MNEKIKRKAFAITVIFIVLGANLFPFVSAKTNKEELGKFLTHEHLEHSRLIGYTLAMYGWTRAVANDIVLNMDNYVLANPVITDSPDVMNVMNFFIFYLQIAYVFAFAATGLYLVLSSASPKNRARAKYMLGKLFFGLVLVSLSPLILQIFLDLSSNITQTILDQGDSTIFTHQYSSMLFATFWSSVIIIWTPVLFEEGIVVKIKGTNGAIYGTLHHKAVHYVEHLFAKKERGEAIDILKPDILTDIIDPAQVVGYGTPLDEVEKLADAIAKLQAKELADALTKKKDIDLAAKYGELNVKKYTEALEALKKSQKATDTKAMKYLTGFTKQTKFLPRPEFTFPYLMVQFLLIVILYGFLALRFLMLLLWSILFPVTIFLTSFELTKNLGKNMIEQTVYWTILQIFYATAIDVMGVGFLMMPQGFDYFGLGFYGVLFVSFFTAGGVLLVLLTPILILIMTQRLTAV